jgi:hypothetical protein
LQISSIIGLNALKRLIIAAVELINRLSRTGTETLWGTNRVLNRRQKNMHHSVKQSCASRLQAPLGALTPAPAVIFAAVGQVISPDMISRSEGFKTFTIVIAQVISP